MSTAVRLPSELAEFIALEGPQTLLIRGSPGSGKSTLCLALLEAAQGQRVLVSNRVSSPELHREFPWLGNNGSHGIQIVDTSSPDAYVTDSLRAAARSAGNVSDSARERKEMDEFLLLPPAIQEAWSQIPAQGPALVVVDSWDALVEQYLGGYRSDGSNGVDWAEIERMLLRRMGQTHAHLVLVLERKEETPLDYLVNGVVVAERDASHDRLERWLRIPKLRGIRVANASYPYTVEGAKFQCIEPIRQYSELRPGHFDPEPDQVPGYLWPGSVSFADAFGRLPVGKTSLFETDEEFPDSIAQLMVGAAIGFAMSRGGHVVIVPSPSLLVDEIWASITASVPKGRASETLRVVDVTGQLERICQGHPARPLQRDRADPVARARRSLEGFGRQRDQPILQRQREGRVSELGGRVPHRAQVARDHDEVPDHTRDPRHFPRLHPDLPGHREDASRRGRGTRRHLLRVDPVAGRGPRQDEDASGTGISLWDQAMDTGLRPHGCGERRAVRPSAGRLTRAAFPERIAGREPGPLRGVRTRRPTGGSAGRGRGTGRRTRYPSRSK